MQLPSSGLRECNKHSKPVYRAPRFCYKQSESSVGAASPGTSLPNQSVWRFKYRCSVKVRLIRAISALCVILAAFTWTANVAFMIPFRYSIVYLRLIIDYCSDSRLPFATWALVSFARKRGLFDWLSVAWHSYRHALFFRMVRGKKNNDDMASIPLAI